jgi:hypothetical protein
MQHLITLEERKHTDQLVDCFCGGGGSGGGLLDANKILGREVQGTFINHWDRAIEVHEANHPEHRHLKEDLFLLDPTTIFPADTTCSLLWASPSCRFFSVARGAACVNEQDRSHATTIIDWVKHLNPEAILVENVPEFRDWTATIQKRDTNGVLIWALNAKPVKELPAPLRRKARETEARWGERVLNAGYTRYEIPDKSRKGEEGGQGRIAQTVEAAQLVEQLKVLQNNGATIKMGAKGEAELYHPILRDGMVKFHGQLGFKKYALDAFDFSGDNIKIRWSAPPHFVEDQNGHILRYDGAPGATHTMSGIYEVLMGLIINPQACSTLCGIQLPSKFQCAT